jgi:hypothetical protein
MKPVTHRQFGGAAIFSIDKAAHRVIEKGADELKLGRWVWTRWGGGGFTVYVKQNAFFHSIDNPRCPRKAFVQDLCHAINVFLEMRVHIILMLDGNSNMKHSDLKTALEGCSLKEAILARHGANGPSTFRRNNT